MSKTEYKLYNRFHSTMASIRALPVGGRIPISKGQIAWARRKLCPVKECPCAMNALGQVGYQGWQLSPEGTGLVPHTSLGTWCLTFEPDEGYYRRSWYFGQVFVYQNQQRDWIVYVRCMGGAGRGWIEKANSFEDAVGLGAKKLAQLLDKKEDET